MSLLGPLLFSFLPLILMAASDADAADLSCENSHLAAAILDADLFAEKLSYFRQDIYVIKDLDEKRRALLDFEAKFGELVQMTGSRDLALKLFQEKMILAKNLSKKSQEQILEAKRSQQKSQEVQDFLQWSQFKILEEYQSEKIQRMTMVANADRLITAAKIGVKHEVKILDLKTKQSFSAPFWRESVHGILLLLNSPDGSKLATVSFAGDWKMMDLISRNEIQIPNQESIKLKSMAFTPDNKKMFLLDLAGNISELELSSWKIQSIKTGHEKPIKAFSLSPDGSKLVTGDSFGIVKVRDLSTSKESETPISLSRDVSSMQISPNGKTVVIVTSFPHEVHFLDLQTMTMMELPIEVPKAGFGVKTVFSGDGTKLMVVTGELELRLVDFNLQTVTFIMRERASRIGDVSFSEDGKKLFVGTNRGEIQIFDFDMMTWDLAQMKMTDQIYQLKLAPDGSKIIAADEDGNLGIWFRDPSEAAEWAD